MSNSIPSEIDHLFPNDSDSLIEVSEVIDKLNCSFGNILRVAHAGPEVLELITLVDFELIEKPFPLPQQAISEDYAAPLVIPCIHTTRFRDRGRIDVSKFLVSANCGKSATLIALQMDIKAAGGDPDYLKTEKPITITSGDIDHLYIHRNQLRSIQHLYSPKQQPDRSLQQPVITEQLKPAHSALEDEHILRETLNRTDGRGKKISSSSSPLPIDIANTDDQEFVKNSPNENWDEYECGTAKICEILGASLSSWQKTVKPFLIKNGIEIKTDRKGRKCCKETDLLLIKTRYRSRKRR